MKSEHPPPMADLVVLLEIAQKSIFKSPVPDEIVPKTESVMSEISGAISVAISVVSKPGIPKLPQEEFDPFPFTCAETGKVMEVNPHLGQGLRYVGKTSIFDTTANNETFFASRGWRAWTKTKYPDTFSKLNTSAKDALKELVFFTSEDKMDKVTFGVLKAFYANLVSIDRKEACVRSWTDPKKMAVAYGARPNSKIIKMPSSFAYIALICVRGNKLKYDEDDVVVYSRLLSIISAYIEQNQDEIFFCHNTKMAYQKTTTKKEKEEMERLDNISESEENENPGTSIDDEGECRAQGGPYSGDSQSCTSRKAHWGKCCPISRFFFMWTYLSLRFCKQLKMKSPAHSKKVGKKDPLSKKVRKK